MSRQGSWDEGGTSRLRAPVTRVFGSVPRAVPLSRQTDAFPLPDARYVEVAVPVPLRQTFFYRIDEHASVMAGCRVRIPFGNRQLIGIVLGDATPDDVETSGFDRSRAKSVDTVLDDLPVLGDTLLALCRWLSTYYHHPIGEVLDTALTVALRRGLPFTETLNVAVLTQAGKDTDPETFTRAPSQREILRHLQQVGTLPAQTSRTALKSLTARGLIETEVRKRIHTPYQPSEPLLREDSLALNDDQQMALDRITTAGTYLLYGVTGSGKTEVYLQLVERCLRRGLQALILIPEISLTPQTTRRFTERFNVPVEILHSRQTDPQRLDASRRLAAGASPIVLGTRSAIFSPLRKPGIYIVDEEHDGSYKQQDGLRYSARDLAVLRGDMDGVPVVLGSATPSLESFQNSVRGRYQLLSLPQRAGPASLPRYQIIDISNARLTEGISGPLTNTIKSHLTAGSQVLTFINRRGFAPVLFCGECRWMASCSHCDTRFTVHQTERKLICHHCGAEQPVPQTCPECSQSGLVPMGIGTERVEQHLAASFPGTRVIRIDRDTTRRKFALQQMLADIDSGEPAILVGTQMLAKGHHFPNVTLVAILDADGGFFSADFKAIERMGQLILQVGGRAGREERLGTVALQTRFPDDERLATLIQHGYAAFARDVLAERQRHELPPFAFHALLRADATDPAAPTEFLGQIADELATIPAAKAGDTAVLGPIPALMEKRADRFRAQLLLRSSRRATLRPLVAAAVQVAEALPRSRNVRWSLDVDPLDEM